MVDHVHGGGGGSNAQAIVSTTIIPTLAQSIRCFRTAGRPRRQTRAKFTTEAKEKVRRVRQQGACLRCRILKIQCSLENPCQPCLQSAVRGSERKVLSFCYCVRTRFADVNIFDSPLSAAAAMQIESLMRSMGALLARIATPADFSFAASPQAFNHAMLSWLTDPAFHLPNGSIVGLCCSSLLGLQFQDDNDAAAAPADTDGLVADFQLFLLATSLVHGGWRDSSGGSNSIKTRDLCVASQFSGSRLFRRLDRVLTPQFLSRCGRESCQVLFLLVLGAALGVAYSSTSALAYPQQQQPHQQQRQQAAPSLLGAELQRSPTLWLAMKEHLCQMLAHHLIFVGSMLGIKLDTAVEQRIIDTAAARWNKAEEFVWADAVVGCDRPGDARVGEQMPGVKAEGAGGADLARSEGHNPARAPRWDDAVPARPPPAPPQLVSIPCPEIRQFQPQATEMWAENPQSWYDMFAGEDGAGLEVAGDDFKQERIPPPGTYLGPGIPQQDTERPPGREVKRRSVWVVRPFDAGPEHGLINVHCRLRGGMGMEGLRAFV